MLIALCATSCASSRVLRTSEELRVKSEELRAARDSVVVEVRDTVREVTTTTVVLREQRDSAGTAMDTVKVTTVTDRTRASDRSQLRVKSEELRVRTDTVYIERRDSVLIQDLGFKVQGVQGAEKKSNFVSSLKWIFAILVALIVLVLVIRFGRLLK